jgi:Tfp pilus assembly protein FimT
MRKPARLPLLVTVPVLAALLALALPAQAQWKWRDANGRLTVSDLPPPRGTPDKDILQRPEPVVLRPPAAAASAASAADAAAAPAAPVSPAAVRDPELQARRQAAEQQKAAQDKAAADRVTAQRAENCQRARSHLAALESGQRIARHNAQGEQEILDDRGRAEETRAARAVIASDCR